MQHPSQCRLLRSSGGSGTCRHHHLHRTNRVQGPSHQVVITSGGSGHGPCSRIPCTMKNLIPYAVEPCSLICCLSTTGSGPRLLPSHCYSGVPSKHLSWMPARVETQCLSCTTCTPDLRHPRSQPRSSPRPLHSCNSRADLYLLAHPRHHAPRKTRFCEASTKGTTKGWSAVHVNLLAPPNHP